MLQRLILRHLFPYSGQGQAGPGAGPAAAAAGIPRLGRTNGAFPPLAADPAAHAGDAAEAQPDPTVSCPRSCRRSDQRARVALFLGCVADAMFPETNAATARVLQENGCEVVIPRGQSCCGAIDYHSGVEQPALELARRNLATFKAAGVDAIIVNAAGCGAMLKDYAHILPSAVHDEAGGIRRQGQGHLRVLDGSRAVPPRDRRPAQGDVSRRLPPLPRPADPQPAPGPPGDDSGPGARPAGGDRDLLRGRRDLQPGPARDVRAARPAQDGPYRGHRRQVVATGNVGCILQIARKVKERGKPIEVVHPVDLLDRAYRGS